MRGVWDGFSLRFVRLMLGLPAKYTTALEAREAQGPLQLGVPPFMAVVWYEGDEHGDVALSLGEGRVLGIVDGKPFVYQFDQTFSGSYLGWSGTIR